MTVAYLPIANTRDLARELRARDLPGQRSGAEIVQLRRERAARALPDPPEPVATRAEQRLRRRFTAEASRRGVLTQIIDQYDRVAPYTAIDRATVDDHRLALITAEGWQNYRSDGNRYRVLAWLYGTDDAGSWARRVPATARTVDDALRMITPATVHKALAAGRRVARQGDVYAVETSRAHDGAGANGLPGSHRWNPDTRHLTHRPGDGRKHRPVKVVWPCRFVQQLYGAASFTTD